jgi:tetratricopeptide (TPR) repeat protein
MDTSDGLEFVNRGAELEFLLKCLGTAGEGPTIVVLRSPPGFGKSSLTDHLGAASGTLGRLFCIVDPSIRGKVGTVILHDGFFLQRIAESLDRIGSQKENPWPSLADFMKRGRRARVAEKNPLDIFSELPSFKHAYSVLYDYVARALSFGRYSPKKLLASDDSYAVAICYSYVRRILEDHTPVIVLREVQHIDLHSLRTLLLLGERHQEINFLVEYTAENNQFSPEHQKLFLRVTDRRLVILDLVQLGIEHLEYLIRRNVRSTFDLTSEYYLSWNGNLRSIVELKFQVGIGHLLQDGSSIGKVLTNLPGALMDHLVSLSSMERLVLAVLLAHVEATSLWTLSAVLTRISSRSTQTETIRALTRLEGVHAFLAHINGSVSLRNDTIANALRRTPAMLGLLALAESALRDHYADVLNEKVVGTNGLSDAVRQYFRLCAKTRDAVGLIGAIGRLSTMVRLAHDQSVYIDAVTSAIVADPDLYKDDHVALIGWAIELAYESGDWRRALRLLSCQQEQDVYSSMLRACALQETGGHAEALDLIRLVRDDNPDPEIRLATELVEALIVGCRQDQAQARRILEGIVSNERYQASPLIGYGYRFFEMVAGIEEGLARMTESIECFRRHGFLKSMAYSQLPAAILHSRLGEIEQARKLIDEATSTLTGQIHGKHILINNRCAVDLLSENPDFRRCCEELSDALRYARDDFSELTIVANLGIAHLELNELSEAEDCAEKCRLILGDHDFADTDIYWPICFNMMVIYDAVGKSEKSDSAREFLFSRGRKRIDDSEYWDFRFGKVKAAPPAREFLAGKRWHPLYLSLWLIDIEGLNLLKPERRR